MKIAILSFVPFPLPDESPTSAIQRTAIANGFKNCIGLLSHLTKATSHSSYNSCLLDNSPASRALQACLPTHPDRIKANFYHSTRSAIQGANALVKGIEVSHSFLRRKDSALCTECLRDGYEKFPKDITIFSNCPFHNRAFLFKCPYCDSKIDWKVQLTTYCKCGKRLTSPKVPHSKMALDQYLLSLFQEGDKEKIASIQKTLTTIEHETHTTDESVKSARRALAIAINRQDLKSMANAIHKCLPCSSVEEIDVLLTIFNNSLSAPVATRLRQRLISTTLEQSDTVAEVTLSLDKLQNFIGITPATWYRVKCHNSCFSAIGEGTKISLENAIKIKKMIIFDSNINDKSAINTHKGVFSISAFQYLTDLPEKTIKTLALNTNLLGFKSYNIKQAERESELLFSRATIDFFNENYVCSDHLAIEWNIPLSTINNVIRDYNFQLKKFEFIEETFIIKKTSSLRLHRLIKSLQFSFGQGKTLLVAPRETPSEVSELLTKSQCEKLLSIPRTEISILIREGIIPCYRKNAIGRHLISKKDALTFGQNHVRVMELSKILNMAAWRVWSRLRSAGIMPISGPLINHGKIHFYKRSSITSIIINKLRNTEKNS